VKQQSKSLAQFASGASAFCNDHCIGISPDNVVIKKKIYQISTYRTGWFYSQIMVEHLNKDEETIDKESMTVNLPEHHTIISAEQA